MAAELKENSDVDGRDKNERTALRSDAAAKRGRLEWIGVAGKGVASVIKGLPKSTASDAPVAARLQVQGTADLLG